MEKCERIEAMELGLIHIVDELMSLVWVEAGEGIPGYNIQEISKSIQVIPIDRKLADYAISMMVNGKPIAFKWNAFRSVSDVHGVFASSFGDCTIDELAVASGMMLVYYAYAMAELQ